jgi:ankyrin repeat protein
VKPEEVVLPPPPTPLLAALWDGDRTASLALVAAGADPNSDDTRAIGFGFTPLHLATDADDPELVRALLEAGADVNSRNHFGQPVPWLA